VHTISNRQGVTSDDSHRAGDPHGHRDGISPSRIANHMLGFASPCVTTRLGLEQRFDMLSRAVVSMLR